jgi:hypothetical protein
LNLHAIPSNQGLGEQSKVVPERGIDYQPLPQETMLRPVGMPIERTKLHWAA